MPPPSVQEKMCCLYQNKWGLYSAGIVSLLSLLTGMGLFIGSHPGFLLYLPFSFLILVYLLVSYFIGLFGKPFDFKRHLEINNKHLKEAKTYTVDVFLPCCGEPLEVLQDTYRAVANLRSAWPVKVYVLDDGGDKDVEALARNHSFDYICRPNRGEHKKAGNIRYGFTKSRGDFICIFDADFCPRPEMVEELLPYFFYDKKIAIVQTPQYFSIEPGQTKVQKGAAYIQELFYRLIQVNRNRWGASICVGTNAVYRRRALEPFGGTALIDYSEDLHTGFMLIKAGWKVEYVAINFAKGLCPENLQSFFVQQYRWCLGSFTLFLSRDFWTAKIGGMKRLCYLSGMLYYMATALGVFFTPLPGIAVLWFMPDNVHWYNLIFSIPSLIYGTVALALWSKAPFGMYALTMRNASYWAYFFAIVDKCRGDLIPWVPTGAKVSYTKRYFFALYTLIFWSNLVFLAQVIGCFMHMKGPYDYNFYPMLALATFYYWVFWQTVRDV